VANTRQGLLNKLAKELGAKPGPAFDPNLVPSKPVDKIAADAGAAGAGPAVTTVTLKSIAQRLETFENDIAAWKKEVQHIVSALDTQIDSLEAATAAHESKSNTEAAASTTLVEIDEPALTLQYLRARVEHAEKKFKTTKKEVLALAKQQHKRVAQLNKQVRSLKT
jgi:chromosome segregation ATPase